MGFTYFDDYPRTLSLGRFSCQDCRFLVRLRPKGYFQRYQAGIQRILRVLAPAGRKRPLCSRPLLRTRKRHWIAALPRQATVGLGEGFRQRLLEGFSIIELAFLLHRNAA
jgi:hypothetical protein